MAHSTRPGIDLSLLGRIRTIPAYVTDPTIGWWKKLGIILGLIYIISPIDAIPDWIPVVGWLDDIGVLSMMYMFMMRELREYIALREERNDRVIETRTPALR